MFGIRLAVEMEWLNTMAYVGMVTKMPDFHLPTVSLLSGAKKVEAKCNHDVVALVTVLERFLKEAGYKDHKMVHFGLTSSDICDTALSLAFKASFELLAERLSAITAYQFPSFLVHTRTHGVDTGMPVPLTTRFGRMQSELSMEIRKLPRQKYYGKMSGPVGLADGFKQHVECELRTLQNLNLEAHPGATQVVPRQVYAEYHMRMAVIGRILARMASTIRLALLAGDVTVAKTDGEVGSSSMPHKVNPWQLERVAGMARLLDSHAMVALENIDLWMERDISHSCVERVNPEAGFNYLLKMVSDIVSFLPRVGPPAKVLRDTSFEASYHKLNRAILEGSSREECHRLLSGKY